MEQEAAGSHAEFVRSEQSPQHQRWEGRITNICVTPLFISASGREARKDTLVFHRLAGFCRVDSIMV
jgi:hypothetical protein